MFLQSTNFLYQIRVLFRVNVFRALCCCHSSNVGYVCHTPAHFIALDMFVVVVVGGGSGFLLLCGMGWYCLYVHYLWLFLCGMFSPKI